MPTDDKASNPTPTKARPDGDLETGLGAAAEAGQRAETNGGVAATDAKAAKRSLDVDRRRKLPTSHPPGEGDD